MSALLSSINRRGFTLIPNALPPLSIFQETYEAFDAVTGVVRTNDLTAIVLEKTADAWNDDLSRSAFYARAPMGFRDRSLRADKEKKVYFQYSPEYGQFVSKRYPGLLLMSPEVQRLFKFCDKLWNQSANILKSVILELDEDYPGLKTLLVRRKRAFPVILRLIRYEPGTHLLTSPHHDKSALTIHMHSDDGAANQFIIGPARSGGLKLSDLSPVKRRANSRHARDAVVFPGMFLSQMGYEEIPASPHAALCSEESRYRHVAVAFWLVPFMFTDHLKTDLAFTVAA